MSRYLFSTLSSPGFLYPMIGLAKQLEGLGHGVAFVSDPGTEARLSKEGLARITGAQHTRDCFVSSMWYHPLCIALQSKHIEYAVQRFQPDVLVGVQLSFGPMVARERHALPLAVLGFSTYLWPAGDADETLREEASSLARRRWRSEDMMRVYNEARALIRLPKLEADFSCRPLRGDLLMLRSVPELEVAIEHLPNDVHLAGACLWEDEDEDAELDKWLSGAVESGRPIVYVQHGRFFDHPHFWPHLIEASRDMDVCVAASVDRLDCKPGEVPANFYLRPQVHQMRILPHAAALVASANSTAVLGALTQGTPALLIPAGGEQPDVAERCKRAGVARVLEAEEVTPERLSAELRTLLADRAAKSAAEQMAAAFAPWSGFHIAAALLEELAARGEVLRQDLVSEPEYAA